MTNDHRRNEPDDRVGLELASPSLGSRDSSVGNGSGGNGAVGNGAAGNGAGGNGSGGSGSDFGGSDGNGPDGGGAGRAGGPGGPPGGARYVPPDLLASLREQVADFADFMHRKRARLDDELKALGSGGGITAQVVRKVAAELISAGLAPWPDADEQTLCDSLMLSLVAPSEMLELTRSQRASFVVTRGQLMIDVSRARVGGKPVTLLVALPARQAPAEPAADGNGAPAAPTADGNGAPAAPAADGNSAPAAPDGGGESPTPTAAVIVGAATVANRPYLSLDRLMTHARRAIFDHVSSAGDAQSTGGGLRAARKLEIVVLLEPALGGGLWIDVDPATSLPAAALAIALPAPPDRIRFTQVLLPSETEPGMLAAGGATG